MNINSLISMFKFKILDWFFKKEVESMIQTPARVPQSLMIEEVMEDFRFKRVHDTMAFLNWKWATTTGGEVPTIIELRRAARQLMVETCKLALDSDLVGEHIPFAIYSGGLKATVFKSKCGKHIDNIELAFILTVSESPEGE